MPFKNLQRKRDYMAAYMRKRRRNARVLQQAALNPTFDSTKDFYEDRLRDGNGRWYPILVQGRAVFHGDSKELLYIF
jgi:hypothetical protein